MPMSEQPSHVYGIHSVWYIGSDSCLKIHLYCHFRYGEAFHLVPVAVSGGYRSPRKFCVISTSPVRFVRLFQIHEVLLCNSHRYLSLGNSISPSISVLE